MTTTTTHDNTETITYTVIPCGTCGLMVHNPEETYTVTSGASEIEHAGRRMTEPIMFRAKETELTTCSDCSDLREQADAITGQFRGASRSSVRDQVRDVVAALAAVGLTVPTIRDKTGLSRLLHNMVPASARITYVSRVAPTITLESKAHAGTRRWEHVSDEQRDWIKTAFAAMLRARVGSPQQVPCPSGGCMFCGVHSIKAKPAQADQVWREAATTRGNLGARRKRSRKVAGHLCSPCAQAREDVGVWGPTAVETAILRHLDRKFGLNTPALNAPAWGALTDAEPNSEPWSHLDLDDLTEKLGSHV